ncbi:hypothetical protein [Paenibacillus sp. Leaf72]|uniref:hypothetical protein n=1 Tax=Paenibacillus sp. Leaf72 TaxID=1736234 RepID=UPI0006F49102|nr:hypothetical protein [Paenibacillus sp. Leaf72]KQN97004.1 hypothetical protein ASF12_23330 [Paenibacillus sp. Leaf72]
MATMKQILKKYAGRVKKMSGSFNSDEGWETNIEGKVGAQKLQEDYHSEMKLASDFVKAGKPDQLERSTMLDDQLQD